MIPTGYQALLVCCVFNLKAIQTELKAKVYLQMHNKEIGTLFSDPFDFGELYCICFDCKLIKLQF